MTDNGGVQTYRLTDGLGSTVNLTDGAGNVTGSYTYDVFGAVRTHTGASTEYGFTGEQNDANGLEYLRARYYDNATGRFLSLDPLGGRYVYARNNPVNATDPTGLCDEVGAVCVEMFGPMEIFYLQMILAGGLASSCPYICPTISNAIHSFLALILGSDSDSIPRPSSDAEAVIDALGRGDPSPFEMPNNGNTFKNDQGLLPAHPEDENYYHEYGVPGEERVVVGKNGEIYYSPDHYKHFQRVDKIEKRNDDEDDKDE